MCMITTLSQCSREIADFPEEIRRDLADALARLDAGHILSMPLSRPMPSIGKGVHELRFRDRFGIYRVIYVLVGGGVIYLIHAFMKKDKKTPQPNVDLAKRRLKELGR
jgi:phage-related protein